MLVTLANLPVQPESVPINMLIPIPGSKLAKLARTIEFVRTIALARIMMPKSFVRLSAGRTEMSDEMQALCFFAGANSIFVGDTLLTAANPGEDANTPVQQLGLRPMELESANDAGTVARYERMSGQLVQKGRRRALAPQSGIDFASNDYLGLAESPEFDKPLCSALARGVPVGSGGSRLLRGNHPEHEALEARSGSLLSAPNRRSISAAAMSPISRSSRRCRSAAISSCMTS